MGGESRFLGLAYIAPYIIGLAAFTAIPFFASLYLSFTDYSLLNTPPCCASGSSARPW